MRAIFSLMNTAQQYAASKNATQYALSIDEAQLETVVQLARAGVKGALNELMTRLDNEGDDAADLLLEILKAARK